MGEGVATKGEWAIHARRERYVCSLDALQLACTECPPGGRADAASTAARRGRATASKKLWAALFPLTHGTTWATCPPPPTPHPTRGPCTSG